MPSLLDYSKTELAEILSAYGQPNFRAKQLFSWLHKGVGFSGMTNMPKSLVERLEADGYRAEGVKIIEKIVAKDKTTKYLYLLADGNVVEGVLMRYKYGNTLCVSTQVGCRINCAFCASGIGGLVRNLTAGEILGQIVAVNRDEGGTLEKRAVTNVVLMGSGEPLDNYDNVTKFLRLLGDADGINISERNVSLSSSGLAPKIKQLADDGFTVTMTLSLHAPTDEIRLKMMPVTKAYGIKEDIDALHYYFEKTGRRVILEYAMVKGVNDSDECAVKLAALVRGFPCHVNLIRLNKVKEKNLSCSDNCDRFLKKLESLGVSATLRRSMGSDIEGACGQLRRRYIDERNSN